MRRLLSHRFQRSTVLLCGYISFLAGLGIAHSGLRASWHIVVVLGLLWLCSFRTARLFSIACTVLFAGCLGVWRGSVVMQDNSRYQALYLGPVALHARALTDGVYGKGSQITFEANHVQLTTGEKLPGKIQLSGFGVNAVYQGDEITASGKLYPGYGTYLGRISYAQLEVDTHHNSAVSTIRRRFAAGMQTALPEPLAPFAMGLLVGQRATLPDTAKEDLLKVGLTHIIAVSGYNLTIILQASRRLLGKRSKRIATFSTAALTGIFLLLTGLSASIVRAAIVSMASLAAGYYGRTFRPVCLIALAAAVTGAANPSYVWSDLSWYLSFLAFFGVLLVGPLLVARLPARYRESTLVAVAVESVAAEVMTLPFVLYNFGQMSRISLLANVLVVALIPLAMLLGSIAGLAGMLAAPLTGWMSWPATLVLTYMLDTAHILAGLPGVFVEGIGLSLRQMLGMYTVLGVLIWLLDRKTDPAIYAKITDRNVLTHQGVEIERTQQMVDN